MTNTYFLLKSLHIFGAVIAFAQRQVTLTDFVFTVGGAVLVLGGGLGNIGWCIPP